MGIRKIKWDQLLFFNYESPTFEWSQLENILDILLGQSHDILEKEPNALNVFAQSKKSVSVKEGILRAARILEINEPKVSFWK